MNIVDSLGDSRERVDGPIDVLYVGASAAPGAETDPPWGDGRTSVQTAPDAASAIDRFEASDPDCVVSEVRLPDADGVDLLERVRERDRRVPFVLFADEEGASRAALVRAVEADLTDYLPPEADHETLAGRVRDAVEEYRAGRALRETGERYASLVEHSPVPIVIYDDSYALVYLNRASADLVNAEDPASLEGRSVLEFVDPEIRDVVEDRLATVLEERRPVDARGLRLVTTDGERVHVRAAGAPVHYEGEAAGQAVLVDATERRRRERQLQRERDRLALLFEHLPTPVVHGAAVDGEPIVRNVNPAFEETFGYDAGAAEGENLDDLVVPEDRMEKAREINRRIEEEGRVRAEVERETVDGRRHFKLDVAMRDVPDGPREGYAIYTDITAQKRRQRDLRRQNERLDEFASVVSHDLRNPLEIARGSLELVRAERDDADGERDGRDGERDGRGAEDERHGRDGERRRDDRDGEGHDGDHLDRIEGALDRMEAIVDEVLDLSRKGQLVDDPGPMRLETAVERARSNAGLAGENLHLGDDLPRVLADRERLVALFENLFRNAADHAGPDPTVEVGTLPEGFYVEDDGPGIDPEERESVLEPGYSTRENGTGLGLGIVDGIARAHGWEVRIAESGAGGARFEFTGVERP